MVNFLTKRGKLEPGSELFGKAFENWCFHEICAYVSYLELFTELTYWRLASGIEVDSIINDMEIGIESKATQNVRPDYLKGLRALKQDHPQIKKRCLICFEDKPRKTDNGIEILPANIFAEKLWQKEIF